MRWLDRRRWFVIWIFSFVAIGVSFWLFPSPIAHAGQTKTGLLRFIFGYGMLLLLAVWGIQREDLWTSRLQITPRKVLIGLLGGASIAFVLVIVGGHGMQTMLSHIRRSPLLYVEMLVLVGPIEELLCRGYFFTRWAVRYSSPIALPFFAILASLMFAALHVFRDVSTAATLSTPVSGTKLVVLAMVVQCVAGIALTFCYWFSTNIVYAMILHSLWDISIESHLFIAKPSLILIFILLALLGTFVIRRFSRSRWERWQSRNMLGASRGRKSAWAATLWIIYLLLSIGSLISDVTQLFHPHPLGWYYADTVEGLLDVLALLTYLFRIGTLASWMWKVLFPTIIVYDFVSAHYEHLSLTDGIVGFALSIPIYIVLYSLAWRTPRRRRFR